MLLVGVLDKVGTFGFLRYCLPLFPDASRFFAPWILVLAVVGILYAALLAMGQSDMKRLVSYTSISHFGFIALGIFAFTTEAGTGAVLYMVNHGIATGLLFLVVGMLIARGGSRQIGDYGGVAAKAPLLAGVFLVAGLASLALPATNSFVSEFLVLIGSFHAAAGVHDPRHRRHDPGRALHPADVPAHDAGPAARACCSPTPTPTPSPRRTAAASPRRSPPPGGLLRVLDLDRRELAIVDPAGRADHRAGRLSAAAARPDRAGRHATLSDVGGAGSATEGTPR